MTKKTSSKKPAAKKPAAKKSAPKTAKKAAVVSDIVEGSGEVQSELYVKAEALCEVQDDYLTKILSVAKMAKLTLEMSDDLMQHHDALDLSNAFQIIMDFTGEAIRKLDLSQIEITDEKARAAA